MNNSVCWQYAIKKQKEEELFQLFQAPHPSISPDIQRISYQVARDFILEYEWLGNMGAAKYCYGLRFGDQLASVVCYASPVSAQSGKKMLGLIDQKDVLQLCRGASAFWAPKWAPSKLISTSLKIIAKEFGTLAVLAYADPHAGEVGVIYQASNAIYLGLTNPGGAMLYTINGRDYHPRTVHRKFGSRSADFLATVDPNYKTKKIHPKHRYLFLPCKQSQRKELLEKISGLIQPFPKRTYQPQKEDADQKIFVTTSL